MTVFLDKENLKNSLQNSERLQGKGDQQRKKREIDDLNKKLKLLKLYLTMKSTRSRIKRFK